MSEKIKVTREEWLEYTRIIQKQLSRKRYEQTFLYAWNGIELID